MSEDAKLVEPFAVQEIFVDGFSGHVTKNGVMSCAGYRLQSTMGEEPQKVVVIRLVWPVASTEEAIADAIEAQNAPFPVSPSGRIGRH